MTKDELIELAQVGMGIHSPNQPEYIVCEALIKALAQPEQEPVAWMHPNGRIWTFGRGFDKSTFTIPLYTTPPQRKPLTDEEVNKLVDDEDWYNDPHGFVRVIEAAHGIKGEA